jgi:hypothetical protein
VIFVRQINSVVQTRQRRHIVRVHSLERSLRMTKSRPHAEGYVSGIFVCECVCVHIVKGVVCICIIIVKQSACPISIYTHIIYMCINLAG